ncbi:DUF6087 family protein [Rhizohabitans arisaemae]|uniref:DUF6087 family protein n=1 Tax=Rhizohabitans arisaemae TaxID=2720610 RepID=UPI0024B04005|nr:DUF6087 family protein [Rhizohabitans arisaemae]
MGKHRRPGRPNQPSRASPHVDPENPLAPYNQRRRPVLDIYRRHRPLHGGANHVRPTEPRVLEEWDGFGYVPVGVAGDLAAAQAWLNGFGAGA